MEESFPAEKPVKSSERYDKSINLKYSKEESPSFVGRVCMLAFFWKGRKSSQ